jgi:hypothetical protein
MLSTLKHDSIVRYEDVFLEDAKASTAIFPPCPLPADHNHLAVTGDSGEACVFVCVCVCVRVCALMPVLPQPGTSRTS